MGDPLSDEVQMPIGEIIPLVESIKIVGREALEAWDTDGEPCMTLRLRIGL